MKKIIVLLAGLTLFAGSAFAGISGTAHDLSGTASTTVSDEICVFCHTPHGAVGVGYAPLWNRDTVAAVEVYSGVDIQAVYDATTINKTDAPLCLSCHDGASMDNALKNPPNAASAFDPAGLGNILTPNAALIGTDLSNDHPIGFNYDLVAVGGANADAEINARSGITDLTFYGSATNVMWCSTCHDVHDNTKGTPFLAKSNAASGLCLTCHNK